MIAEIWGMAVWGLVMAPAGMEGATGVEEAGDTESPVAAYISMRCATKPLVLM